MKRVIVHCGMHKTGSSSIQATFASLDTPDVLYAQLGERNHSAPIMNMFSPNPESYGINRKRGHSSEVVARQRQAYLEQFSDSLKKEQDTIIVSAEALASASADTVTALHDFILQHGREPQYCAYVREPIGYASSHYQQKLKSGGSDTRFATGHYRAAFEKFDSLPDGTGITLWPFDPGAFSEGSVVKDFAQRLGLSDICPEEKRANESLSEPAAKLLYVFNNSFPVSTGDPVLMKARRKLVVFLSKHVPGKSFKLPNACFTEKAIDWSSVNYLRKKHQIDFEDKIRSILPAKDEAMSPAQFTRWMQKIPKSGQNKLARMMDRRKIHYLDTDTVEQKLSRLYLHFVKQMAMKPDQIN